MAQSPKRKEAPVEPFKRALALAVRGIAGDDEIEVSYATTQPALDGKSVRLPEPSRSPTKREIAVLRGQADSLALTAACHDPKVHRRVAPHSGPARTAFEAVERARIESLGSMRMPGMADNISAKIDMQYGQTRFADIRTREEAPLEDALALMIRERLTGRAPPKGAEKLVELWRDDIEKRAGLVENGHDEPEPGGDHEVHRGPGERDDHLLPGILGHLLEHGDAADRQQRDVFGCNAVAPRGERMAVFVQHDAEEEQQDEGEPGDDAGKRAGLGPVDIAEPDEQQEERRVDIDVDPGETPELHRPFHHRSPSGFRGRIVHPFARAMQARGARPPLHPAGCTVAAFCQSPPASP